MLNVAGDLDANGHNVTLGPFATLNITGNLLNAKNLTVSAFGKVFIGGDAHPSLQVDGSGGATTARP